MPKIRGNMVKITRANREGNARSEVQRLKFSMVIYFNSGFPACRNFSFKDSRLSFNFFGAT